MPADDVLLPPDGRDRMRGDRPPLAPSVLVGVGLGGFVDGIVLHQVLQWHHMLTATADHRGDTVADLEANVLADGLFHAAAWTFVVIGTLLAVRAWQADRVAPPWGHHVGGLLAGWGAFNLVEGLINHHVLGVHHVRDDVDDPLWWDLGFLLLGVGLVAAGGVLIRAASRANRTGRAR